MREDWVREALLPQISDERLATIVKILDARAGREFVMFNGWGTDHWRDPDIRSFLDKFPDPVP